MDPVEIELKFQVPAAARAGVQRALATATAQTVRLQAVYVDTADQRLAAAGMALRLRKEGRRWVQTLKGRGDGLMARLEHEVLLQPQRGTPALDPARHAGTAIGQRLLRLLADGTPLQQRYRTDMQRLLRRVRSGGAVVEVAFDSGRIVAGAQAVPVCELEFELVSGPAQPLLALAGRWVARHGLWLDVRTKSERGHRLALGLGQGLAQVPAMRAPARGLQALLQAALPNAAELSAGTGTTEHLRQLRLALRRLGAVPALGAIWQLPLQQLAGLRMVDAALPAAQQIVRDPAFTHCVLQTLAMDPACR